MHNDPHDAYADDRNSFEWFLRKKFLKQKCPRFIRPEDLWTWFSIDVLRHVKSLEYKTESLDDFSNFILKIFESYTGECWYIIKYFKKFQATINELLNAAKQKDRTAYLSKRNAAIQLQTKVCAFCDEKHSCKTKDQNDDLVTFFRAIDGLLPDQISR